MIPILARERANNGTTGIGHHIRRAGSATSCVSFGNHRRKMKPTTYMKAPNGNVRKVEGERLAEDLQRQGWTATDERPAPKVESRKKRGEYVNHTNFSGW